MSWINSNATYKQNSKNDLSFYHGFSKTPVEPTSTGTAATTLGNASTKGGHTVIGTEVWAEEIPWFGLVPSRAVAVTRLSGLTKLNDLVKVDGEGGKVYKYIGADDATFTEAQWSSFWQEVTLTNGMTLNNRHNQPVLRYYLNQPMQTLTTTNNASIDSKGYATRLFVDESTHLGQTSGGAVVSQFAAGTDNIKNGIPSVELNPKLYLGTTEKIAGTHYYDYNVSGTVLWSTAVTSSSPKISCFRYIGKTVTGQLSTVDETIKSHAIDISDIKATLGMESTNPDGTPSVTARVETVEDVVRVLLGLGDSDTIAATESISTTANSAATTAITSALETEGSIAQAIETARQSAINNAKVTLTAGTGISIPTSGTPGTSFEVSIASDYLVKASDVTAISGRVTTLETVTVPALERSISGVSQTVADIQTSLSTGTIHSEIAAAQATADAAQAAAATADGKAVNAQTTADEAVAAAGVAQNTANAAQQAIDATNAKSLAQTGTLTGMFSVTTAGTVGAGLESITITDAGLATAISDAKKAGTDAQTSINTTNAKTLTKTGTLTGMFSVTTAGTVGTGLESITITDSGLSTAISAARTNAVADVKALTLSASDTDDAAKVTVALGGTVQTPTITVTTSDIASAQTLATLKSTVETHISEAAGLYLSVEKVDALPAASEAKTNKIYLVPVDSESGRTQNIHTEYIWTNGQWEIIGTTAIDINSLEASAKAAQDAADAAQGEVDALETVVATLTQTHATDKAALEGSITGINNTIAAMDATQTVNGLTVTQADGKITGLTEALITASVPAGTTSVEGNVAYVGSTKHVIAPEKFQTAATMPNTLTSWVADLSNLVTGDSMFAGCTSLTTFIGDLSSLTSATNMFNGCTLDAESLEILAENLPTVTSGTIDIGAQTNATTEVIATIKGKGWTVTSNGAAL